MAHKKGHPLMVKRVVTDCMIPQLQLTQPQQRKGSTISKSTESQKGALRCAQLCPLRSTITRLTITMHDKAN